MLLAGGSASERRLAAHTRHHSSCTPPQHSRPTCPSPPTTFKAPCSTTALPQNTKPPFHNGSPLPVYFLGDSVTPRTFPGRLGVSSALHLLAFAMASNNYGHAPGQPPMYPPSQSMGGPEYSTSYSAGGQPQYGAVPVPPPPSSGQYQPQPSYSASKSTGVDKTALLADSSAAPAPTTGGGYRDVLWMVAFWLHALVIVGLAGACAARAHSEKRPRSTPPWRGNSRAPACRQGLPPAPHPPLPAHRLGWQAAVR